MILFVIAFWLVGFGVAQAGVLAAGAVAAAGYLSSVAAGLTATQVIGFGLTAASVAYQVGSAILSRGSRGALSPSEAKETIETQETDAIIAFGRVRLGGALAFANSAGFNRYRLMLHCEGEFDAIEAHYLNGSEVILYEDGNVASPPWVKPLGGSYCQIINRSGAASLTAWAQLTSNFPTLWTSNHKTNGITQTLLIFNSPGVDSPQYLKLYPQGVPQYEMVVRANTAIYDPRIDATGWTDNGVLICAYALSLDPSIGFDKIDWDHVAIEAARADVLVATKAGLEKRARAWGFFAKGEKRRDVAEAIAKSIGAEIRNVNGKERVVLIDDNRASEFAIEARDILSASLTLGLEAIDRPNKCRVKYYSPERNYEMAELDMSGVAWANIDGEVTRYGEKYFDVELRFCPSPSQAQRIARRLFYEARAPQGVLKTNLAGLAAWGVYTVETPLLEGIQEAA